MPVFQIQDNQVNQLRQQDFSLERELHTLFEQNLETLLGIRFVASEYRIGAQLGYIDTLGLDENNTPVIIEYKLDTTGNVLDQGLTYYRWLKENRSHFELLVKQKLGAEVQVNWEQPRVIIIAKRFTRYTVPAAENLNFLDLIRYSLHEGNLLLLDKVTGPHTWKVATIDEQGADSDQPEYGVEYHLEQTRDDLREPFKELRDFILNLGELEERDQQKTGITYRTTKALIRFEFRATLIDMLLCKEAAQSDDADQLDDITSYAWGYPFRYRINRPADIELAKRLAETVYNGVQ